jgi:hypothetical protein
MPKVRESAENAENWADKRNFMISGILQNFARKNGKRKGRQTPSRQTGIPKRL